MSKVYFKQIELDKGLEAGIIDKVNDKYYFSGYEVVILKTLPDNVKVIIKE